MIIFNETKKINVEYNSLLIDSIVNYLDNLSTKCGMVDVINVSSDVFGQLIINGKLVIPRFDVKQDIIAIKQFVNLLRDFEINTETIKFDIEFNIFCKSQLIKAGSYGIDGYDLFETELTEVELINRYHTEYHKVHTIANKVFGVTELTKKRGLANRQSRQFQISYMLFVFELTHKEIISLLNTKYNHNYDHATLIHSYKMVLTDLEVDKKYYKQVSDIMIEMGYSVEYLIKKSNEFKKNKVRGYNKKKSKLKNKNMKYYFQNKDSETCYNKIYWLHYMKDNKLNQIELIVAKSVKDNYQFFCREVNQVSDKGNCGKNNCNNYKPRNGVSGCCKHVGKLYEPSEEKCVLRIKQ